MTNVSNELAFSDHKFNIGDEVSIDMENCSYFEDFIKSYKRKKRKHLKKVNGCKKFKHLSEQSKKQFKKEIECILKAHKIIVVGIDYKVVLMNEHVANMCYATTYPSPKSIHPSYKLMFIAERSVLEPECKPTEVAIILDDYYPESLLSLA